MKLRILDFKGINEAEIDLRQGVKSILAGNNSSGKSSILQSVLMISQSLIHPGPIVLNGSLVQLGVANEIIRSGRISEGISFEFSRDQLEIEADEASDWQRVKLTLSLGGDKSTLHVSRLEVWNAKASETVLFDKVKSKKADVGKIAHDLEFDENVDYLLLKSSSFDSLKHKRPRRTYLCMRGLVPIQLVQVMAASSYAKQYEANIRKSLKMNNRGIGKHDEMFDPAVLSEFVEMISKVDETNSFVNSLDFLKHRYVYPYRFQTKWRNLATEAKEHAIVLALSSLKCDPSEDRLVALSFVGNRVRYREGLMAQILHQRVADCFSVLSSFRRILRSEFQRINYLGPLRIEPRVVFSQYNEPTPGLPVGSRGELTALVLSRNANKKVSVKFIDSEDVQVVPLAEAVNKWLGYLEIGESAKAKSLGKLGVRMDVEIGGEPHDLTSVGVGVSQALPIIVAVLSLPREATFLIEQPELHLHPAVQAKLADFLLVARQDVTMLVESHSEAFITRVRRRVAEHKVNVGAINVVFVEVHSSGSETRKLEFTKTGDLTYWPKGFMAGSAEEDIKAIIKANLAEITRSRENAK